MNPRRRVARGRSSLGLAALAVALGLVSMLAPVASARTYSAPYAHFTLTSYGLVRQISGCATEKTTTPTFDPHTGVGGWTGRASATSCSGSLKGVVTSSIGESGGGPQVALSIRVPAGSAHSTTVAVTWNFSARGAANLVINRPCPTPTLVNGTGTSICVAQATAMVDGAAYLIDLTNGTTTANYNFPLYLLDTNTSENTTTCSPNCTYGFYNYSGGAPFSGPQSVTFDISAITNHADRYALVTYLAGSIVTEMQGYGGHASGYVNLKSAGNSYQLVSVVVT